jgi:hypothetical protein
MLAGQEEIWFIQLEKVTSKLNKFTPVAKAITVF